MIISNSQVQTVLKANYTNYQKRAQVFEKAPLNKADVLVLSNRAKELGIAKEQVLKSPEVRADRINELKKLIQDGNYNVSGTEIAQKMINRSLVDELAGR